MSTWIYVCVWIITHEYEFFKYTVLYILMLISHEHVKALDESTLSVSSHCSDPSFSVCIVIVLFFFFNKKDKFIIWTQSISLLRGRVYCVVESLVWPKLEGDRPTRSDKFSAFWYTRFTLTPFDALFTTAALLLYANKLTSPSVWSGERHS